MEILLEIGLFILVSAVTVFITLVFIRLWRYLGRR